MSYVHITTRDACSDGGGPVRKHRDLISLSRDSSHHHPSFFLGHLTYPSTIFPLPRRIFRRFTQFFALSPLIRRGDYGRLIGWYLRQGYRRRRVILVAERPIRATDYNPAAPLGFAAVFRTHVGSGQSLGPCPSDRR